MFYVSLLFQKNLILAHFEEKKTLTFRGPCIVIYEGWNFNSGNYLFTTDTK